VKKIGSQGNKSKHALVSISQLIKHVISESKCIYKDTPHADDFIIFRDGLTQWLEKEAQELIRELGFEHRQLRCVGATNKGNRYEGKVCGDSPEICRSLDAHGFADLKVPMSFHTRLSSIYAEDDPRRFGMGVPKEVWRTMVSC
jgi:hypothetical protein